MPTIISTTKFTTRFAFDLAIKQFKFTDTTDYATPAIPLTGVRSNFKIVTPSGVTVYNNTVFGASADIITNVSTTNATTIPLSFLANGTPEQGLYVITMTTDINDGVNPPYVIVTTNSYTLNYAQPQPSLSSQVDCISPLFVTQDVTNYTVNSVSPVITRTFVLQFPTGSGITSITNTTSATIVTPQFASGTQASSITSGLVYTFPDGLVVTDTVTGALSTVVDCSNICQVHCCLVALDRRLEAARGNDDRLFDNILDTQNQVMNKVGLLLNSVACGKQVDAEGYMAQIKSLSNCQSDCTCTDGAPRLITGLAGLNNVNVIVVGANSSITVNPVIVSGVTTYTIAFSPTLTNIINNSWNTVVAQGANITVVDSGPVSGGATRTFTVSANIPASTLKDRMWFRALIAYSNYSSPTVAITAPVAGTLFTDGSNFISPTIVSVGFGVDPNWATNPNYFIMNGFQTVPDNLFTILANMVQLNQQFTTKLGGHVLIPSSSIYLTPQYCILRLLKQDASGEIHFQFVNAVNGVAYSNTQMVDYANILINFELLK